MCKKYLLLPLFFILILGFFACGSGDSVFVEEKEEDEVIVDCLGVIFPDESLEAAMREEIGKPEGIIVTSDLEELTSLDTSERSIADLSGLEYCTNLTELDLTGNQVDDISPLTSLTNLTLLFTKMNPLSGTSIDIYIPQLEERGVEVNWLFTLNSLKGERSCGTREAKCNESLKEN